MPCPHGRFDFMNGFMNGYMKNVLSGVRAVETRCRGEKSIAPAIFCSYTMKDFMKGAVMGETVVEVLSDQIAACLESDVVIQAIIEKAEAMGGEESVSLMFDAIARLADVLAEGGGLFGKNIQND